MLKRRRERDRPKAAPNAPYNPNKRILLSYASDDESPDDLNGESANENTSSASAPIPDSAHQQKNAAAMATNPTDGEGLKAIDHEEEVAAYHEQEEEDRPSIPKNYNREQRGVQRNVTTGQMAALGSLSYQWEDDDYESEYDSETDEAIAYLRAVRSERQNMPVVLRAPSSNLDEDANDNGMSDTRGYFEDGAYVASANFGPHQPPTAKSDVDPQEVFTLTLKQRFLKHRKNMHLPIDSDASPAPDGKHLISLSAQRRKAKAGWMGLLQKTLPMPAQIQAMAQEDALNLLEFIRCECLTRGVDVAHNVSVWIWSLLARLDDVGSMNNDQVYLVREFGKRAVLVQLSFTDPSTADRLAQNSTEEMVEDDAARDLSDDEGSAVAEENLTASNAVASAEGSHTVRQNTMATLDTIIVLVGDVFRQRDLLEFRQSWQESIEILQGAEVQGLP